ncbi:hypothetical protein [Caballeronia sp. HLA56]
MMVVSGCSLFNRSGLAPLVATPAQNPDADPGCSASDAPVKIASAASPVATSAAAARLQSAFATVREETWFGPIGRIELVSFKAEFDEAWLLVVKAKAQKTGRAAQVAGPAQGVQKDIAVPQGQVDVPLAMRPDEVEGMLLDKLPWASETGIKPDEQLQKRLATLVRRARMIVDEISIASTARADLNTLLPTREKPATQPGEFKPTATAGSKVPLKTFTTAGKGDLFGKLTDLASFRAFHLMALLSAAHIHEMLRGTDNIDQHALETQVRLFNVARYLSAYFDAYFRGGQFIQFDIDETSFVTSLSGSIAGKVKTGMSAGDIQKLISPAFDDLCKSVSTKSGACGPRLGSSAFVTRAGLSVQFAGISYAFADKGGVGLTHSYPQLSQFGPQMIRVFVEAIFDANGRHLKGAPNSTACQASQKLFDASECLIATDPADEKLQQIDMLASGTEALATTGTGVLVRGFAMASSNNELIAQMLETLAGVNARKITERVLFLTSYGAACPIRPVSVRVDNGHTAGDDGGPADVSVAED